LIDRRLLEKLAGLARLHLPADRQPTVLQHVQRIIDAFDALRGLPTSPGHGSEYPLPLTLPLRPDEAQAPMPLDQVLANAPRAAAGTFVVPRVVDA
jgi:aspartyl/glutamyl-tRNA(Asn/Gln) amidotransferase C subunit